MEVLVGVEEGRQEMNRLSRLCPSNKGRTFIKFSSIYTNLSGLFPVATVSNVGCEGGIRGRSCWLPGTHGKCPTSCMYTCMCVCVYHKNITVKIIQIALGH